ncbi:MAG TPA: hypothetical protein VJB97_04135 [Candidatus Paceibacterota bacterium]
MPHFKQNGETTDINLMSPKEMMRALTMARGTFADGERVTIGQLAKKAVDLNLVRYSAGTLCHFMSKLAPEKRSILKLADAAPKVKKGRTLVGAPVRTTKIVPRTSEEVRAALAVVRAQFGPDAKVSLRDLAVAAHKHLPYSMNAYERFVLREMDDAEREALQLFSRYSAERGRR